MSQLARIPWAQAEDSSNLESTFYHEPTTTLCVRFRSGGVYSYMAPRDVYVDLINANSMGKYLNAVVKAYPYTRWDNDQALLDHLNVA